MMKSYGVNTLISDSGVMKYRIVAERWEVNEVLNPPRWIFKRGIFMEQFDQNFHTEAYVQADTAFYYTTKKLWHLIGNVRVKTIDGLRFTSDERMQHYTVSNSVGSFKREEEKKKDAPTAADTAKADTTPKRAPILPRKR